jgi:hypothetical protein
VDWSYIRVGKITDPDPDLEYWRAKTPLERLQAAELIRQVLYGYDAATARLPGPLELLRRPRER